MAAPPMRSLRWAALWLIDWPLQHRRVSLTYAIDARRRRIVSHVAPAWRRRGILPGMALAEAEAIRHHSSCGSFSSALADRSEDRSALQELAAWCRRLLPTVGLDTPDRSFHDPRRCETLISEVTHVRHYYGDEHQLLRQVARTFARRRWRLRMAIASSIDAARAAAYAAPASFTVVPPWSGDTEPPRILAELPLEAIGWPADTQQIFRHLGLRTLGQLLTIPRDAIGTRFGLDTVRRVKRLGDDRSDVVRCVSGTESYEAVWRPGGDSIPASSLAWEPILQSLCQELSEQLRRVQRGAWQLTLTLTGSSHVVFPIRLAEPTADAVRWFDFCRTVTDRASTQRAPFDGCSFTGSIEEVRLEAVQTVPVTSNQLLLFPPESSLEAPAPPQAVPRWTMQLRNDAARWIERLMACLSSDAVQQARPVDDVAPERRWEGVAPRVPLAARNRRQHRHTDRSTTDAAVHAAACWPEPLFHVAPPRRIDVTVARETAARESDAVLRDVRLAGRRLRVARQWGPQRLETGWWRGDLSRRRYYWIETEGGFRWSIFHCLRCKGWYWHGWE